MNTVIVVPTLNAGSMWERWISALLATGVNVNDVYVIDSKSSDDTVIQADKAGFKLKKIEPETFGHGSARQMVVDSASDYDFVIFLTQDAILSRPDSIKKILSPFKDAHVGAVCGRQLPKVNSGVIETHARLFNYPDVSSVNTAQDIKAKGLKAAFLSNSFAAYRISTLNSVGGFPEDVIFGEDMYVAIKMLLSGYKIAYAADACVYHSHDYSFWQEMRRYFDMGVFHARESWIRQELGGAEGEGIRFVISEFKYLLNHAFWQIPEALLRTFLRYAGFRLGLAEKKLPLFLKKKLAMNKGYFK